ncbi:hypothetical protein [Brachybacterium alimentarium]|uniref:Uncharacterized protein n=1 Tax=Brachybacterium alimentarium TaxID=47845 RepID=A0A2A3YFT7_9MICO|nr:hypothetical protein [Brachybacterium alimentarium]PCC38101.1 hypothetical protein CIK66_15260 [Brachybacterium alimentarium]
MTDMHDDAARQIVHQLRARMFTETLSGCPATPSRYIETAERIAPVLDVQAALGGALDGGDVIHLGDVALTPAGAAALRDHLGELLTVLGDGDGDGGDQADPADPTAYDTDALG